MATRLKEKDVSCLLSALETFLPSSAALWGVVKSCVEGQWTGMNFWVDRWPDFRVAIGVPVRGKTPTLNGDWLHYIFSTDVTTLRSVLRNPDVIDWSQLLLFEAVMDEVGKEVQAVAKERQSPCLAFEDFHLLRASPETLLKLDIPDEMTAGPVTAEDVQHVVVSWKYRTAHSVGLVRHLVQVFPSLMLRHEDGRRVGHGIMYHHGMIGLIFIYPEFRRQGYGKLIFSLMSQKAMAAGRKAYVSIDAANTASQAVSRQVGFERQPIGSLTWVIVNAGSDLFLAQEHE